MGCWLRRGCATWVERAHQQRERRGLNRFEAYWESINHFPKVRGEGGMCQEILMSRGGKRQSFCSRDAAFSVQTPRIHHKWLFISLYASRQGARSAVGPLGPVLVLALVHSRGLSVASSRLPRVLDSALLVHNSTYHLFTCHYARRGGKPRKLHHNGCTLTNTNTHTQDVHSHISRCFTNAHGTGRGGGGNKLPVS